MANTKRYLQICAETIQMRRDGITNFIRDPLVKTIKRNILPSNRYIFNTEQLSVALEKAGGVKKAFYPPNKISGFKLVSQTGNNSNNKKATCYPSQGSANIGMPSQSVLSGTRTLYHA
jgi:hypothetical protein